MGLCHGHDFHALTTMSFNTKLVECAGCDRYILIEGEGKFNLCRKCRTHVRDAN